MDWKRTFRRVIVLLVLVGTAPLPVAYAHPADMFLQTHTIHLTPTELQLEWSINPGPLLAAWAWSDADTNVDQVVSEAEARAWVAPPLSEFSASLNDLPLEWRVLSVVWPASYTEIQSGEGTVVVQLAAAWPKPVSDNEILKLHNRFEEASSINWYYLHGEDGIAFQKPYQQHGQLEIDFSASVDPTDSSLQTYWDSGVPSLPPGSEAAAPDIAQAVIPQLAEDTRPFALLTQMVRSPELSLNFFIIALAVAAVLGALHALTPGHGKTVVAAYLVGTQGTTKHAITLGSIVTLTHTGSVFVLGLLTLAISQYILPTALFPVLEIFSSLLIVGLGAYLLYQRWLVWRAGQTHHHHHDHHHDHDHDHHHHHLPDPDQLTWRSLIALGVSGGLVPCPDAIAILLVAIAINRILLGLSLIVAFSLGLALVLIAIGLAMVHSRRLFEKMDTFSRVAPAMPVVSAVVVLILGLGLTYNAVRGMEPFQPEETIKVAAQPQTAEIPAVNFQIDEASVLFIGLDEGGLNQLFKASLDGQAAQILTNEPAGIVHYTLSPDGKTIAYTALRSTGGADLWAIDTNGSNRRALVGCEEAACSNAVWSPDGQRLIYQHVETSSAETSGSSSLWWLALESGETGPLFQDGRLSGSNPRWSPNGEWLSYVVPGSAGLQLYHLQDSSNHTIPNQMGAPVIWSPDGTALLVNDIKQLGTEFATHLYRFDLADQAMTDLSGEALVVDSSATWSPDGAWLAIVRRDLVDKAQVGSHIWLMRPDGSQAHPITSVPDVAYGQPVWSPDGSYLLFHRYALKELAVQPGVFLLNIENGEMKEIYSGGNRPVWVFQPGGVPTAHKEDTES